MNAFATSVISADLSISHKNYTQAFVYYISALECETIASKDDIDLGATVVPKLKSIIDNIPVCVTDQEKQKYIIKTIIDSGKEELIEKIGIIKSRIFQSEA